MRYLALCMLLLPLLACSPAAETPPSVTERLDQLIEQIWHYQLEQDPLMATYVGSPVGADRLPDISPSALQVHDQQLAHYLMQLDQFDPLQLDEAAQLNLAMMQLQLTQQRQAYQVEAQLLPITSEGGFYAEIARLYEAMQFSDEAAYRNYLKRLTQLPDYFAQQTDWLKEGLRRGITLPQAVLGPLPEGIAAIAPLPLAESPFYVPFSQFPASFSAALQAELKLEAKLLIEQQINPAYRRLQQFFVEQYLPGARTTLGVNAMPGGDAYYRAQVRLYTTTELEPRAIHNIGLAEVARIRAAMLEVMAQLDFNGELGDFLQFLRTDPQFYPRSGEQLLHYAAWLAKRADAALPRLFDARTLPRQPYGVAPVPDELAPRYTTGRYAGSARADQPGYYWVNTYALDKRPLYEMEALTLHEAVPGHHLQISLARELALPPFRKHLYLSAFGEGWGLYAEYLGKEMGFYTDPYSEFGRLSYEMWRAARLVVDTGIHALGWSRQQAIRYMAENTALSMHNIETEVDRYISWPGQALSYKLGELTIKRLRQQAEQQLGERFDVRDFHYAVLKNGALPLTLLEGQVERYIDTSR